MTPNPYESPREASYNAPKPGRLPLWVRIVRGTFTALAIGYVGWITIAVGATIVDLVRQYLGF